MRAISTDELKEIQIKILDYVHQFCLSNNIHYWIDCGTLLGAIRHKGYIPWDDDIDIGMLREDYNQFMEKFNNSNTKYQFRCPENDKTYSYGAGKVIDTDTLLYEPDKNGRKLAVNIDVVVYDNAPDNDKIVKRMFRIRDWYRKCSVAHNQKEDIVGGTIRNIGFHCLRFLTMPFPKNFFSLRMVRNSRKYEGEKTLRVGNFLSYSRNVGNKDFFNSFIDVEFEGKIYKAPVGYDAWLKSFYNDYMKLPSPEKRISTHKFEAYIKE